QHPVSERQTGDRSRHDAQRIRAFAEKHRLRDAVDRHRSERNHERPSRDALAHPRRDRKEDEATEEANVDRRAPRTNRHRRVPNREAAMRDAMAEEFEWKLPGWWCAVGDGVGGGCCE